MNEFNSDPGSTYLKVNCPSIGLAWVLLSPANAELKEMSKDQVKVEFKK